MAGPRQGIGLAVGQRAIVVVGRQFAGKSTFARFLHGATGFRVIEIGRSARIAAREASTPVLDYTDFVFSQARYNFFLHRAILPVPFGDLAIIVGPRRPEEVDEIARLFNNAVCIGVLADLHTRLRRWVQSPKPHDIIRTTDDWTKREELETKWGIDSVLEKADILMKPIDFQDLRWIKNVF